MLMIKCRRFNKSKLREIPHKFNIFYANINTELSKLTSPQDICPDDYLRRMECCHQ